MPISTTDLQASIDPTNFQSISGANLLQLISGATPYTDKGLVIVSTDAGGIPQAPNADVTTKWANYIWVRIADPAIYVYAWNPNADSDIAGGLLRWQSVSLNLAPNSVNGSALLAGTVPATALAGDIDFETYITGFPEAMGGDLTGNYPNPTIKAGSVDSSELADLSVIESKLGVGAVDPTKTLFKVPAASAGYALEVNGSSTLATWVKLPSIASSAAVNTTTGSLGKIPQVATEATADGGTWLMKSINQIMAGATPANLTYTGVGTALVSASTYTFAHGLGQVPSFVRAVLRCDVAEEGYAQNDEIDIANVESSPSLAGLATVSANATNVIVQINNVGGTVAIRARNGTVGAAVAIDIANWTVKVYAKL